MPNLEAHQPGSFCWAAAGNQRSAWSKRFYNELFAWTANDVPIGPNDFYTMFQLRGKRCGGRLHIAAPIKRAGSTAPLGCSMLRRTTRTQPRRKQRSSAGRFLRHHSTVFDVGRMAVIQDPTGRRVRYLAKRSDHHGTGVASEDRNILLGRSHYHRSQKGTQNFTRNFLVGKPRPAKTILPVTCTFSTKAITSAEFRRYKKVRELPTGSSTIRFLESSPWQEHATSPMGGRPISLHLQCLIPEDCGTC